MVASPGLRSASGSVFFCGLRVSVFYPSRYRQHNAVLRHQWIPARALGRVRNDSLTIGHSYTFKGEFLSVKIPEDAWERGWRGWVIPEALSLLPR